MAEATIDELRIEVEAESAQAASNIDKLVEKLERLNILVAELAGSNGITKIAKQLKNLSEASKTLQSISGFENITKLANSLNTLSGAGNSTAANINPIIRSLRKFAEVVPQINALPNINTAKIGMLSEAVAPLQSTNVTSVNSFLNALKKIPKIATELQNVDLDKFTDEMNRLAQAMAPLAEKMNDVAKGFSAMPAQLQRYITQMESANAGASGKQGGLTGLSGTLGGLKTSIVAAIAALSRLKDKLADCVIASNQFVENLNLFTVTMGDSADEAYRFAETVNDAMGIDTSDWVRYQGFFQSIGKGFGIATQKADLMSQNLTQLSYDLSSFYNTSVDEAYNKVVSGISGKRTTCPLTKKFVLKQSLNSVKSKLLAA